MGVAPVLIYGIEERALDATTVKNAEGVNQRAVERSMLKLTIKDK